jgi:hypothetical protein
MGSAVSNFRPRTWALSAVSPTLDPLLLGWKIADIRVTHVGSAIYAVFILKLEGKRLERAPGKRR